jgi:septal ring factor EnvC (AmiA/AmiB activator)
LVLLADSGSADEIVRLRILVAATAPAIAARTAALSRELAQGSALEGAAVDARNRLQRNRRALADRRVDLARLEQQATLLAGRRGSEALGAGDVALARQERLTTVQETAQSSRASARSARALADLGPVPFRPGGAGAKPPLDYILPADAAVTDGLGAIRANGVRSRGITLATRRGTPLVAPASGTVLFAGPFRDYDGIVIIDHGNGWKSVLVNAGSKVRRGSRVSKGEPIGIALGPVEIELQHSGDAVSPALIAGSSAVLSNPSKGG